MSFDVSGIAGVGGAGKVGGEGVAGADLSFSTGSSLQPTDKAGAAAGSFLLDGLGNLQVPESLLSGGTISAADVARLNVDILNFTTSVTAVGAIRKEFTTAKTQLLSEGKQ